MTPLSQNIWPAMACALVAAIFWIIRVQARSQADARTNQLNEAANLLACHAGTLERFLGDRDAPVELKRLLIAVSDAMADRDIVTEWANWTSSRPFDAAVESAETEQLVDELWALQARRGDLFDDFLTGIWTAIAGATLRWPESAALAARMFSRMATTPKQDVAVAVTVTKFCSGMPFSMRAAAVA